MNNENNENNEQLKKEVEGFQEITAPPQETPKSNIVSLDQYLEEKYNNDSTRDPDKPLGFYLDNFKKLQGGIDGLREGFYLIGAESNVGKTAFLVNLCMNVIESNTGQETPPRNKAKCLYFSIDDSRERIIERIYSRATNIELWKVYKKQPDNLFDAQLKAKDDLVKYYRENRIDFIEMSNANQIIEAIEKEQDKQNLVIIIDGLSYLDISNYKIGGMKESEQTKEIKQAEFMKEISLKYKIPAIGTVEVKKPEKANNTDERKLTIHDIKGSTSLPFRADFVLLLNPKSLEKFYNPKNKEVELTGFIGKNKLGRERGKISFIHYRNVARLEEDKETKNPDNSDRLDKNNQPVKLSELPKNRF